MQKVRKMCILTANKVLVEKNKTKSLLIQKGFGEKTDTELVLDLKETLFLLEKKKISVKDLKGKKVSKKALLKKAETKEKNFYPKYLVYKDFRERGYVIKTGFKFGFDFRAYPRGKKAGQAHSKWVIQVFVQEKRISMPELSRMIRLSANIKTTLILAVVDSENDINYFEAKRLVP